MNAKRQTLNIFTIVFSTLQERSKFGSGVNARIAGRSEGLLRVGHLFLQI